MLQQLGYTGDLIRTVNPIGSETLFQVDGAGRQVKMTDPLGYDNRIEYNGVNQVTKVINPLLQETRTTYDAAQRPAAVIDPRQVTIERYQYDSGDRVTAVTDALNKSTNHQYDSAGRLTQFTDRKGQVILYSYDNLGRVTTVNFPGATRNISYDVAGRISRIEEPDSAITYAYDAVDRVISVTTDSTAGRHIVGYEYDNIDRLVRRTVNGGDPTVYAYDNASRITSINYRNQTTIYTWNGLNRLTSKTLPNGIKQELAYDDADRLLSLTYRKSDNSVIETITYTYDAKGQRLSKTTSGASARETPFTATYDAANRMTGITLTATNLSYTLTYDDNGNLTSKTETAAPANTTTYSWDSRNRLTGITAPGMTASFKYDVLNRRIEKTVNGNTVNYIYDGAQAIAEVTAGAVSAAILTGLNIDEMLARYAASGNRAYLTDALGSVIAQANDAQAIENYYAYSPYGETTALAPDGGNAAQYTARENDGTGLYYYRARYYDPVLKRFISEDPIGLAGGINAYAYVGGNPVSFADPSGLQQFPIPTNGTSGVQQAGAQAMACALNPAACANPVPASGNSSLSSPGGFNTTQCVRDYLKSNYPELVGDTLVPNFSVLSYVPGSGTASTAIQSSIVSGSAKVAVAYAPTIIGNGLALIEGAGAGVGAGTYLGSSAWITAGSIGTGAVGVAGAATIPFSTVANIMALCSCRGR